MRTYYPTRPAACVKANFFVLMRIDIKEEISSEEEEIKQYSAEEIKVYAPYSKNKIFEAFMKEKYGNDYEAKLINEYISAQNGLYTDEAETAAKIKKYKDFLIERLQVKTYLEQECEKEGIK